MSITDHSVLRRFARARAGEETREADRFVPDAPRLADASMPAPHGAGFRVEWRPLADLGDIEAAWRDLAHRALEPNVFYAPDFALAAASVFGAGVGALLVWSRHEPQRLVGFMPLRVSRRRYGLFPPVLVGWTHPYAPFGVPLIDGDEAEAAVAAAFDFIARSPDLPRLVLLPLLPSTGRWAAVLAQALSRGGGRMALFGTHRRAILAPSHDRRGYLDQALRARKRKELRRQARRLSDQGALVVSHAISPQAVARALDAFMALEAQGWKGRAGGAAAMDADVGAFMRDVVGNLSARDGAWIIQLMLDDRLIASGIVLRSGDHAWFWKIAYDETVARASPGVQLTLELTQALLDDDGVKRTDSCATADHPMIDKLWLERLDLADHLVQIGPGGDLRFALACALETARRAAIGVVKRVYSYAKRR
jgi:CelD/BcsL family acetyltransferase involved in cellulose biosynthesis